jgi:hypothetical protein
VCASVCVSVDFLKDLQGAADKKVARCGGAGDEGTHCCTFSYACGHIDEVV